MPQRLSKRAKPRTGGDWGGEEESGHRTQSVSGRVNGSGWLVRPKREGKLRKEGKGKQKAELYGPGEWGINDLLRLNYFGWVEMSGKRSRSDD